MLSASLNAQALESWVDSDWLSVYHSLTDNDYNNFISLFYYQYICGVNFPNLIELEQLLELYIYHDHDFGLNGPLKCKILSLYIMFIL